MRHYLENITCSHFPILKKALRVYMEKSPSLYSTTLIRLFLGDEIVGEFKFLSYKFMYLLLDSCRE